MGVMCYRVYNAEMVAIELLYTHERAREGGEREKTQTFSAISFTFHNPIFYFTFNLTIIVYEFIIVITTNSSIY